MKAADYRGWLERRELTHEAAGRALGVHKSTSKRYGDGSITSPLSIELARGAGSAMAARRLEGLARGFRYRLSLRLRGREFSISSRRRLR